MWTVWYATDVLHCTPDEAEARLGTREKLLEVMAWQKHKNDEAERDRLLRDLGDQKPKVVEKLVEKPD